MPKPLSVAPILASLSACVLAGCLFDSKDSGYDFRIGLYGEPDTVYALNADGSRGAILGWGVEMREDTQDGLLLWPDVGRFEPEEGDTGAMFDTIPSSPSNKPVYFLRLTRDSTRVQTAEPGLLFPLFTTERAYAGHPCRFSNLRGSLKGEGGVADTISLVFSDALVTTSAEGVRLIVLIDTAASRAADARSDFSHADFYGSMRVTCP